MWNVSNSADGPLSNKSMNQIPHQGAKSAHSEMRGSSQSLSTNQNINDCHSNHSDSMQNNVQKKMDSTSRYNNDIASSHNASGGFMPSNGNNWQRNISGNGAHSNSNYSVSSIGANSDSNVSHKGSSFGAQYNNSSNNRAKNQMAESNFCGNGNNSPYSAWPRLNSTSVSSSNGWIIPNNHSSRKGHDVPSNSNSKEEKDDENVSVDGEISYSDLIGATGGSENIDVKQGAGNIRGNNSWGMPSRLGLLGGGESSVNSGSNNWSGNQGPVASAGPSTWESNRQMAGTTSDSTNENAGMSPPKPHNSWAQAAGKGLNPCGPNAGGNNTQGTAVPNTEQTITSTEAPVPSEKVREETALSELKMKAATSEGWGQVPVNQDAPWDVPASPPPPPQSAAEMAASGRDGPTPPVWRTPVNNGTEIWQNNLRLNKGAATPVTSTAPPWGHTPSTNIGGHWGDDDSSGNMWSGVGPPNAPSAACWSEPSNPPNTMWGNTAPTTPVEKQWGNHPGGTSWNDGADNGRFSGNDNGTSVWNPPLAKQRNVGSWSPAATPKKDIQPTGWELPSPPTNRRPLTGGNFDDGTAVWGNPQRQGKVSNWKDMPSAKPIISGGNTMNNPTGMPQMPMGGGMPPAGPGMIRLPTASAVGPKNDMGSTWNRSPSVNRNSGWQDMPAHDGPNIGTWGEDSLHMSNQMKNMPVVPNAAGGNFGGGWNDHNNSAGYWGAKPKGASSWADGQVDTSSWLGPSKQGGKPLSRDLIWSCKQFRMLIEMGYKKEDAENALRNNNMNIEETLYELRNVDPSIVVDIDAFFGRKVRPANPSIPDEMSMGENVLDPSFGAGSYHGANSFQVSSNYQTMGGMGAFKPQVKGPGPSNPSNLLSAALGQNSIANFTPAIFQKILQQQQQQQNPLQQLTANMQQINNQGNRGGNFPSAAQLRHLVQQIQMAVHAGHLNPQILNQPLAPQTLQLLYQLLQQIKVLHQLQQQQLLHVPKPIAGGGPTNNSNAGLQLNVQVTQTKQRIVNLQNQIAAQQAVFLKQQVPQQPQPHQGLHSSQNADIFKPNIEPMPSLQSDFRDMSIKDVPLQAHQQSRLNQWKLPSYEKEDMCGQNTGSGNSSFSNEFSRAPGPLPSKNSSSASSSLPNPGPNLHPLLSQGDSAWSSLSRSQGDSGWPEPTTSLAGLVDNVTSSTGGASVPSAASVINMGSGAIDSKESSSTPPSSGPSTSSASHTSYNLTDLVPEFEPGKPWKGTQLKNIEDDPHITPGSITRSPLSVNTIKDTDFFWNSKSNPVTTSGNDAASTLASSTWNFTPSNTTVSNSSSAAGNKSGGAKSNWSSLSSDSGSGSDVWGSVSKSRGPPPGISAQGSWDRQSSLTFLLLRNLTPQIDGSTLKTLCMQHGPLQLFHLSLNHGIALVRYSTREEAAKAQSALNNCVLGNTTILADIPNETEVQQYLVLLTNQNSGNMGWPATQQSTVNASGYRTNSTSYPFNSSSGSNASNSSSKLDSSGWNGSNLNMPSSQVWSFPNTSSALWGSSQPMSDHEPSTNSSLNRFLPDDLLGGESM